MKCPICYHEDTRVVDSRVASDGLSIRRRRECLKCEFRFSTFEEIEILDLSVLKRNGQKEAYSREKIVGGLKKALEKRAVDEDRFKKLVHNIEREIQKIRKNEVTTEQIGEIIMKQLKKIDPVAYIRFASVYQDYGNLQDFQEELDKLSVRKVKVKDKL
jgi:transcriptional repressor NrdR